jgi:hypothetical protein
LAVPGSDAVGIGTLTHLAAWAAGSADASAAEFYGSVDTAVLVGWSPAAAGAVSQLRMLASRGLRQDLLKVSVVDSRAFDELGVTEGVHVVSGATPLAVVGRNRARALRVTTRDVANRLVVQDVRAQLVLRPRGTPALDLPVDVRQDRIRHRCGRVVSVGRVLRYVYVAGWAGRNPLTGGSHAQDAQHVVAMLASDVPPPPLGPSLVELLGPGGTGAWKPIAEVEGLLKRFAGEGSRALADYDDLLSRVEDE